MSYESAMLVPARRHVLRSKALALVREEATKGCRPDLALQPVTLEPPFVPVLGGDAKPNRLLANKQGPLIPPVSCEMVRLQIWFSPNQHCDWLRSELFLKQLSMLRYPVI